MNMLIKATLMAVLVLGAAWPLANWAKSLPWDDKAGIHTGLPIAPYLMTDEDMLYGD